MTALRFAIALLSVYLFLDSTIRSARLWRRFGDARSLRNLVNNIAILTGAIALAVMVWVVDFAPDSVASVLQFLVWAGLTVLLIAGLFTRWSWGRVG